MGPSGDQVRTKLDEMGTKLDQVGTNGDQVGTKWDQVETNSKILISTIFRRFLEIPKAKIHIFQWSWKVSWGPKWDQVGPREN